MLARREVIEVPEFYVGTIMAVTIADAASPHPNKLSRFVGICIDRGGTGVRAWFILRNVVEGQGIEFMYQIYSPTVTKIEVLRLEVRLDDELYYLRDAPQEYSTIPFDMEPEILPEGSAVPVNNTVVKLNSRPWLRRWETLQTHIQAWLRMAVHNGSITVLVIKPSGRVSLLELGGAGHFQADMLTFN